MLKNKSRTPIDKPILPLLNLINSIKKYKTTSSCAGRICLMKSVMKKRRNIFIKKWHRQVKPNEISDGINNSKEKYMWFREEGIILHVIAMDIKSAKKLLSLAQEAGLKHSGIISLNKKPVLEIVSTERMDCPLVVNGKIIIDKHYISVLVKEANLRLKEARKKMKRFYRIIKENFIQ